MKNYENLVFFLKMNATAAVFLALKERSQMKGLFQLWCHC